MKPQDSRSVSGKHGVENVDVLGVSGKQNKAGFTGQTLSTDIERIKARQYECFIEDHEPLPWTPGRCAGYAGRGSLGLHLFRCKRRDGHGLGGLFCSQHAKAAGDA